MLNNRAKQRITSGQVALGVSCGLGAPYIAEVLAGAGFDWVLIDSPPVMAVTDASVIAHVTGGVVFVVGADMTGRDAAQQAVEQLESASGRFVGAVLNRVDFERNGYYYSRYYRSQYDQYYVSKETPVQNPRSVGSSLQL